jgi:hypothetical protein
MFLNASRILLAGMFISAAVLLWSSPGSADPGAVDGIIPPDRKIDWSPGIPGGIPEISIVKNAADYGAIPNDGADDRAAIQNAIDAAHALGGGAVFLPAGTYDIKSRTATDGALVLKSGVVIRGEGADRTFLQFDLSAYSEDVAGFKALAWSYSSFTPVTGGYSKGSATITVSNASYFSAGDYAEIEEENDDRISNESWALNAVGEIVKITGVNGNQLTLERPLNYGYDSSRNPQIRRTGMITNAGIERLHLKRQDSGPGQMILLYNVANVWVREVESEFILNSHVLGIAAYQCEIRDSYFHEAWGYGSGGQGYGVNLERHTTNCLVENNVFRYLRHPLITQVGASGHVFSYNYSFDRQSGLTDVSLHGHFPSYNLFEGNIVQEVDDSDHWGASGPGNTFFRMCVQAEGIQLQNDSDEQNVVGNVLGDASPNIITADSTIQDTLKHGNYEQGGVSWDPAIPYHDLPDSYYLLQRPDFYEYQNMAWPSTGPDINTDSASCMNPARQRWNDGKIIPHPFYLRIEASDDDILLQWVHRYEYNSYEIWRSVTPYFTPGDAGSTRIANGVQPPAVGDGASYIDVDAIQDGTSYYYRVRGVGAAMSTPSNERGLFIQTLTVAGS